jgi:hypothetical protein
VLAIHAPLSLDGGGTAFVQPPQEQAVLRKAVEEIVQEDPETSASTADSEIFHEAPQRGNLLFGPLSVNLPALQRTVDAFFARLEGLARDMATLEAPRLFGWLVAAAVAAGALDFTRRRLRPPQEDPRGPADARGDPSWAPYPVLAFLPPESLP